MTTVYYIRIKEPTTDEKRLEKNESQRNYYAVNGDKFKLYRKKYYLNNKDYYKQWGIDNADKLRANSRKYYLEKGWELNKRHYEANKEFYSERSKIAYQKHKEEYREKHNTKYKNAERYDCPCGKNVVSLRTKAHDKTAVHQRYLQNNT